MRTCSQTGRLLPDEELRWLTERGSTIVASGRNRPVYRRTDKLNKNGEPATITMGDARREYEFKSVTLFQSELKVNTTAIEDKLQEEFMRLPLGIGAPGEGAGRCWRRPGMGNNGYDQQPGELKRQQVFMCYSFKIAAFIRSGKISVQR